MTVTSANIRSALIKLGIEGRDVEVHSSFKSFGGVSDGPLGVIRPLLDVCSTVLMPAFHSVGRCKPPLNDRPLLNGIDYTQPLADDDPVPFDPDSFSVHSPVTVEEMGVIPALFLNQPGAVRSVHPAVSWVANGPNASHYMKDHPADDPNIIAKRLYANSGFALLFGVALNRCTSVHLAEELAGAKALIRWARYKDGTIHRYRVSGCSAGFDNLAPFVKPHLRETQIGNCRVACYPLADMIPAAVSALRANRSLVVCGRAGVCRCKDTAAGGPVD
ncbi:MAG: AAC(3) family N-acetyltransferase [Planctomycetota bacterium]